MMTCKYSNKKNLFKITQICKKDCDNIPTQPVRICRKDWVFCCQKGYKNSLNQFSKDINKPKVGDT